MTLPFLVLLAMLLDALIGEPRWLWSRLPHPAVLMGQYVALLDRWLNKGRARRLRGIAALTMLVSSALAFGLLIETLPFAPILTVLIGAFVLAQRSLADHLSDVAGALDTSLDEGRLSVARIVGRDTRDMTEPEVARAAIESGAENLSDGIVAPIFWFLLAGLPGLLAYKMVNTADSMIGYRTPKYEQFGWAAARLDDVLNWVPARLTAALILLSHLRPFSWSVVFRDAPLHRSPNAGWPEAAMATVLGIALSGPRSYAGEKKDYPFVNVAGRKDLGGKDIRACVGALWRSWVLMGLIVAALAIAQ